MSSTWRSSVQNHLARMESALKESLNLLMDDFKHQNASVSRELQWEIEDLTISRIEGVQQEFFALANMEKTYAKQNVATNRLEYDAESIVNKYSSNIVQSVTPMPSTSVQPLSETDEKTTLEPETNINSELGQQTEDKSVQFHYEETVKAMTFDEASGGICVGGEILNAQQIREMLEIEHVKLLNVIRSVCSKSEEMDGQTVQDTTEEYSAVVPAMSKDELELSKPKYKYNCFDYLSEHNHVTGESNNSEDRSKMIDNLYFERNDYY